MSSRYFTSARRLLPCAAISTRLPRWIAGAIVSCQYGRKRATVSLSDSVSGSSLARRGRRSADRATDGARSSGVERRRRDVVAAAPDLDLRFAVLRRGLRLVQPLQRAVVALVQPPAVDRPGSTSDRARRARSRACGSRASAPTCRRGRRRSRPPSAAGRLRALPRGPRSDRSTSVQPVKRFSLFQVLSPWRSRTSVCMRVFALPTAAASDRRRARVAAG